MIHILVVTPDFKLGHSLMKTFQTTIHKCANLGFVAEDRRLSKVLLLKTLSNIATI